MSSNPLLPNPPNIIRKNIRKFSISNWKQYWSSRPDCRQTKLWLPEPNFKHSKDILILSRTELGLLTRWITGHCYLARHQSLIHFNSPECNLCQQGKKPHGISSGSAPILSPTMNSLKITGLLQN